MGQLPTHLRHLHNDSFEASPKSIDVSNIGKMVHMGARKKPPSAEIAWTVLNIC